MDDKKERSRFVLLGHANPIGPYYPHVVTPIGRFDGQEDCLFGLYLSGTTTKEDDPGYKYGRSLYKFSNQLEFEIHDSDLSAKLSDFDWRKDWLHADSATVVEKYCGRREEEFVFWSNKLANENWCDENKYLRVIIARDICNSDVLAKELKKFLVFVEEDVWAKSLVIQLVSKEIEFLEAMGGDIKEIKEDFEKYKEKVV